MPTTQMKILPKTSADWSKLAFAPFRAFIFAAFVVEFMMEASWPRHGGSAPDWVVLITLGFVVSFCVFLSAGIHGLILRKPEAAVSHFLFAGLAFVFGYYSLRFLASA